MNIYDDQRLYEPQSWAELKAERKAKKARNRQYTLSLLRKMGITFEVGDGGGRARWIQGAKVVHLNPGTGSWAVIEDGNKQPGRGVYNLLHYLATGVAMSRELIDAQLTHRAKGGARC